MPLRAARGSFLCRSAALIFSRSLRCAARRAFGRVEGALLFAYPAFTPRPELAGTRRHAGLLSVVPRCGTGVWWRIFLQFPQSHGLGPIMPRRVEDFSFSFPSLMVWAQ